MVQLNDTTMYYIRKGEVLYKRKQSGNGYVLYQANGVRWKKVSSMWAPYNKGKTFYYDKNGTSLYRYFNASYSKSKYRNTVWIYDEGSSGWQQVTDKLLNIHSDYYYIPEDGVIKAEEGWQTIDKKLQSIRMLPEKYQNTYIMTRPENIPYTEKDRSWIRSFRGLLLSRSMARRYIT